MATARLLKKMGKLKATKDGKWKDRRLKGSHDKFIGDQRTSLIRKTSNAVLSKKAYVNPNDLYQPPEKIEDTFELEFIHLTNEGAINKRERGRPIARAIINDPEQLEFVPSNKATSTRKIAMLHPGAEYAMSIDETAKRNAQFYRHTDVVSKDIGVNLLYKSEEQGKRMQSVYDIANMPSIDNQGRSMQGLYGVGTTKLTKNPTFVKQNKSSWALPTKSQSFKQSVITKCINRGADISLINKLEAMDADRLMELFDVGLIGDIEEYFDYDDDYEEDQGFVTHAGNADALEVIEKYEEYYGTN